MSRQVTSQEWERFKKRELSPEEMSDVSRRIKEFGLEVVQETPAESVLLRLAGPVEDDLFDDDTLSAYVGGSLDPGTRASIDEARRCDPVLDKRLLAVEAVDREIQASLAAAPEPAKPKRPFLMLVTSGGWVAAAACLAVLAVVMPRMTAQLKEVQFKLKQAQTVEPGVISQFSANEYEQAVLAVPKDSKYASSGNDLLYQLLPGDLARRSLRDGVVQYTDAARNKLTGLKSSYSVGLVQASPDRTIVCAGTLTELSWSLDRIGVKADVTLTGPDGDQLEKEVGVDGGSLKLQEPPKKEGRYVWTVEYLLPDGTHATSRFEFEVADPVVSRREMMRVAAEPDPLSKAIILAEDGFRHEALQVLTALAQADPANTQLARLLEAVKRAP